jgi:hypothetical protein
MRNILVITISCCVVTSSIVLAEIRSVPGEYPNIQAAVNASQNGDEVVIANGVYTGPGNYNINFIGRVITVRSGSGDPDSCIIDIQGQFNGQLQRGFIFEFFEGPSTVLKDLSIINGVADGP